MSISNYQVYLRFYFEGKLYQNNSYSLLFHDRCNVIVSITLSYNQSNQTAFMISNTSKSMLRNYIISNVHCSREINIDLGYDYLINFCRNAMGHIKHYQQQIFNLDK